MGFLGMLMQVIWVGVILSVIMAATTTTFPLALPNCPDSCGNVTIPYPFGTTEGCYLNDPAVDYFINCTSNAYGQPQPMIWNIKVISISMEGEIDIQMLNSIDCYDQSGTPLSNDKPEPIVPGFTVSVTKNKFVAVGCDTYAYLNGNLNDQPFSTGSVQMYGHKQCMDISNILRVFTKLVIVFFCVKNTPKVINQQFKK